MSNNRVKLNRPHTHAGYDYQPGDEITLDDEVQVAWLESIGAAERVPAETEINIEGE